MSPAMLRLFAVDDAWVEIEVDPFGATVIAGDAGGCTLLADLDAEDGQAINVDDAATALAAYVAAVRRALTPAGDHAIHWDDAAQDRIDGEVEYLADEATRALGRPELADMLDEVVAAECRQTVSSTPPSQTR